MHVWPWLIMGLLETVAVWHSLHLVRTVRVYRRPCSAPARGHQLKEKDRIAVILSVDSALRLGRHRS